MRFKIFAFLVTIPILISACGSEKEKTVPEPRQSAPPTTAGVSEPVPVHEEDGTSNVGSDLARVDEPEAEPELPPIPGQLTCGATAHEVDGIRPYKHQDLQIQIDLDSESTGLVLFRKDVVSGIDKGSDTLIAGSDIFFLGRPWAQECSPQAVQDRSGIVISYACANRYNATLSLLGGSNGYSGSFVGTFGFTPQFRFQLHRCVITR